MTAVAATAVRRHPTLDMGRFLATPGPEPQWYSPRPAEPVGVRPGEGVVQPGRLAGGDPDLGREGLAGGVPDGGADDHDGGGRDRGEEASDPGPVAFPGDSGTGTAVLFAAAGRTLSA